MKKILEKRNYQRSQVEQEELADLISQNKFFAQKNIKREDMVELVNCFKFDVRNQGENVFDYGDKGEHFYIIIKGMVGVFIPNPAIANWKRENKEYH